MGQGPHAIEHEREEREQGVRPRPLPAQCGGKEGRGKRSMLVDRSDAVAGPCGTREEAGASRAEGGREERMSP